MLYLSSEQLERRCEELKRHNDSLMENVRLFNKVLIVSYFHNYIVNHVISYMYDYISSNVWTDQRN